jgi:GDP/UDP-N,N'-diacetylbacillosamine 2-epimerase (hydrolysing)
MKRKVIFVSGSRADYGLLKKLILLFKKDYEFETYIAVTGAHLSKSHGHTVDLIKHDFVDRVLEVDMGVAGDQALDISQSIATGIEGFASLYQNIKPDFIFVLGDRYELWAACIPASLFNIPIVHIHGGELTQGVIDETVRHSITKMSHLHFCSHESYRQRVIRMGEHPNRVFTVGAVGLDRISETQLLPRLELESKLNISFGKKNVLCTFHPVTLDPAGAETETAALVAALEDLVANLGAHVFITFPNSDTNSSVVRKKMEDFILRNPTKAFGFVNLGDQNYLSLMKEVDLVLGNSSSGILEAPFLRKAVVNVGVRQQGRLSSAHVVHAEATKEDILEAVKKSLSSEFQDKLGAPSIYGEGHASQLIYRTVKTTDFTDIVFKIFNDGTLK